MAAILCQSVSNLCGATCDGIGKICKLPFTLCSSVCKPMCEGIKKGCASHFCLYTSVALGLNIPGIIFGLSSVAYIGCKGTQWLLLNILFCVAHITAAYYLASKSESWSETMKTLCYDPWIAAYILAGIGSFAWLGIGMSWAKSGAIQNGNCPDNIDSLTYNSIYCGYAFFGLGMSALLMSMLLSSCMGNKNSGAKDASSAGSYFAPNASSKV
jgi:hypothetical protein